MISNDQELVEHYLGVQAREIAEISERTEPFEREIAGIRFTALPNVFPGGVDSELTCEALRVSDGDAVLDLCTGTGIIAFKAARLGARKVVGVDLNPRAVQNAKLNRDQLGLSNVEFFEGYLFDPVAGQRFDVITINPPFTDKKPTNKTEICFWDEDNLTTKRFFRHFREHLNPGGRVYFAWANFGAAGLLERLADENRVRLELVNSRKHPVKQGAFLVYEIHTT